MPLLLTLQLTLCVFQWKAHMNHFQWKSMKKYNTFKIQIAHHNRCIVWGRKAQCGLSYMCSWCFQNSCWSEIKTTSMCTDEWNFKISERDIPIIFPRGLYIQGAWIYAERSCGPPTSVCTLRVSCTTKNQ